MVGRSRYWFLVLLFGVIAATALPGRAWAQATTACTIAMSTTAPVIRVDDTSNRSGSSSDPTVKLTITRADCLSTSLKYRFAMTVTGYNQGWNFEAWAGRSSSDCSGEFTALTSLKTCWKLGNLTVSNGVATLDVTPAQLLGIGVDDTLAPSAKKILTSCDDLTNTDRGRQTFTVSFFLNYSSVVQCKQTQGMYYSLTGPDGPTISSINAADSSLQLNWQSIVSTLTTDVTYEFYCARNDATDGGCHSSALDAFATSGASSTASGGAGGTSSTGAGGTATVASTAGSAGDLGSSSAGAAGDTSAAPVGAAGSTSGGAAAVSSTGGSQSSSDSAGAAGTSSTSTTRLSNLYCGSVIGKSNTSGYTDANLTNGKSYAVTIGVRDSYGNIGSLSPYVCDTPQPIDTFFEGYSLDGGKAGGGFCNLDVRRHGSWPAAFGAIGLLAWLRRRNQQVRRRETSDPANH